MRLRIATLADAAALAPHVRPADAAEVLAATGRPTLEGVEDSLRTSEAAWALELDGELAALLGVAPGEDSLLAGPSFHVAWMITAAAVDRHPAAFGRATRRIFRELLAVYPVLFQAIDARHLVALRWARWLGAEVLAAVPFGPERLPFHPVILRRPGWVS